MTVKELFTLARRLYHLTPDVPAHRIRIAVTQTERDNIAEYMRSVHMIALNVDLDGEILKICGIQLVVDL